jgi:membrane-associated protease RseP (regulator of RpoE activity)
MELQREILDALVQRYFVYESVTEGKLKNQAYIRYVGRFVSDDTSSTHQALTDRVHADHLMVLFRSEEQKDVIYFMDAPATGNPSKPWKNLVFFILTLVSVLISGAIYSMRPEDPTSGNLYLDIWNNLGKGWPFALSLLAILGAHEFGHYFAGRYHKTAVTLPFFIPFPFSAFGTLGAFIQMKDIPRNKNHLLDIGIAGPLAGLMVAIPVLILGLSLSKVEVLPAVLAQGQGFQLEGNSILYLALKALVKGQLLPTPATYGGISPIFYWIRYFFTGQPYPLGGSDVMLHPVAWAGWAGLLVTSLNLIPAGQLDGGHLFYVLFGEKGSKRILPAILVILTGLGFFWNGWWLWVALILFFGRSYAQPQDMITPLDNKRKWLARVALFIFLIVFIPVPLIILGG